MENINPNVTESHKTVCVWRQVRSHLSKVEFDTCSYCSGKIFYDNSTKYTDDHEKEDYTFSKCLLCGREAYKRYYGRYDGAEDLCSVDILKYFDINSCELSLSELRAHLHKNYADIYSLDPHRFEILVAEIFRNDNRRPILTQQTRDGGVDIFLFNEKMGEVDAIVECKRYSENRKVGIAAVERLAGVAIKWDASKAILVTTSTYTRSATNSAELINKRDIFGIELVSATELLQMLKVYNEHLPSLDRITIEQRNEIIQYNETIIRERIDRLSYMIDFYSTRPFEA